MLVIDKLYRLLYNSSMTNLMSISDVRAKLPGLVKHVNKHNDRVLISVGGQPKAVIMSMEDMESWEETMELMAIPGLLKSLKKSEEQFKKGQYITLEEFQKKNNL